MSTTNPNPARKPTAGPYHVEKIESDAGPRWRLVGPGLDETRAYPWLEVREKLDELAAVMNFAWQQGRSSAARSADE